MHEAQMHKDNSFITLTYSDQHLPPGGTLVKKDFQDFIKRLRKQKQQRIRYYHCGEYGENFNRPHYHALLFGYAPNDLRLFSEHNGIKTYSSDELSELWPYGFSNVGEVTFESAGYVARYAMKKITGGKAIDHYGGLQPEYSTMSRRPGIGADWFHKFTSDVLPRDYVVVRGVRSPVPRYYLDLYSRQNRSNAELIKIKREMAPQKYVNDVLSDGRHIKVSDRSLPRLRVQEVVKIAQLQNLKRPLEVA
ncbi:MAG: replication initiator protein [Microviridae sp.]|nr:MAG: replication initiator protein [Microviridae sp.]